MKNNHKKKRNLDLLAAHVSHDITPKILPQYDFQLPVDANSLTSEQALEYKESIHKLSKEFRLKAMELYLKIAKEEFDFQEKRLNELLADFPPDRIEIPLTQATLRVETTDHYDEGDDDDDNDHQEDGRVYTQRATIEKTMNTHYKSSDGVSSRSSELYGKYVKIALERNQLEIEREVHFLVESGVQETPSSENKEVTNLISVLRKDFTLLK